MARARTTVVGGSKQLQERLDVLARACRETAERVVREEAEALVEDAQRLVPVDTGELKRSIRYEADGLSARAGSTLFRADFVERGTSSQKEQPFMTPAAMRSRRRFGRRMGRAITEQVSGL